MEIAQVEVTVTKAGLVSIRVLGVKGTACRNLTAELEQALGGQIESRTPTAEAYEPETNELLAGQQIGSD